MTPPVAGQQKNRPRERSLAPCHLSKVSDTLVNFLQMCHLMKDKNQARGPAGSTLGLPWAAYRKPARSPRSHHCRSRRQAGFPLRTSRVATRPGRSSAHAQLLSASSLSHSAAPPSRRNAGLQAQLEGRGSQVLEQLDGPWALPRAPSGHSETSRAGQGGSKANAQATCQTQASQLWPGLLGPLDTGTHTTDWVLGGFCPT